MTKRAEALAIIRKLDILAILSQYGEARVVGSVALDVIVKKDIDLHVVVEDGQVPLVAEAVCAYLSGRLTDCAVHIHPYLDRGGVKVGVEYFPGRSGAWTIDVWITDRPETTGFALADELNDVLTPEHRRMIRRLKRHIINKGGSESSMQIYRAVVYAAVRTAHELDAWLE